MVLNDIKISQKMKNKSQLGIEKDVMKCKKNNSSCSMTFQVFSYKNKNGVMLGQPRIQLSCKLSCKSKRECSNSRAT